MNSPQMNKTAAILITTLLSMVAIMPQAAAAPQTPEIRSVELNLDAGTMIITGRFFGGLKQKAFRGNVRLHLAETGPITFRADLFENFVATEAVPARLQRLTINGLPQNLDDFAGVHLLEVRRKYSELVDGVSVAKFVIGTSLVTIGAEGPEGPKGDTGDAGPKGDAGNVGPKGDAGAKGIDGTNGTNGKDGEQGPAGTNGSDGVGVSQTTIDAEGNLIVTLTNGTEINAGRVRYNQGWRQLGTDIDGEAQFDGSGWSVSLSADGSTVAIGAISNSGNGSSSGHVRIYQYIDSSWQQLGADIDGEAAGDQSGTSVSLSADGSTVAIGARDNDGNGQYSGHVRIYQYIDSSWQQLGSDIDGEAAEDFSGWSVSLSADGSTVAIGAPSNDDNGDGSGHVRVYRYINSNWVQLGADINGEAARDESGSSVSLSADGSIVAIGAPKNGLSFGHVRIYQYINSSWQQLGADIDGESGSDYSGWSVSLSADGSTVAIGAYLNSGINSVNSGSVRVYQYTNSSWQKLGSDIDGEGQRDLFGHSVSLSADGGVVAIGAPDSDGNGFKSGRVRVYRYTGLNWVQLGTAEIDGEALGDQSGWSVSLSADGNTVAIGAPQNDGNGSNSGHVRVYELTQEP